MSYQLIFKILIFFSYIYNQMYFLLTDKGLGSGNKYAKILILLFQTGTVFLSSGFLHILEIR